MQSSPEHERSHVHDDAIGRRPARGRVWRSGQVLVLELRAAAAFVSVVLVVLPLIALLLVQRLQAGPIPMDPVVPWLQLSIEERLGRPVVISHLRLRLSEQQPFGMVLDAGPVVVQGDHPVRVETLLVRIGLPLHLEEVRAHVGKTDALTFLSALPPWVAPDIHARLAGLIGGGMIEDGDLRYRLLDGRGVLQLQIAGTDVLVRPPNGLPPVFAASAEVAVDNDVLHVTAPSAESGGLTAHDLDVTVDPIGRGLPSLLHLSTKVEGETQVLYRLFTSAPLDLLPHDLVDVSSVGGRINGDLTLGLPLLDPFDPARVELTAKGQFTDLAGKANLPTPVEVTGGSGRFSVEDGAILVDGDGKLHGSPFSIVLRDRWRGSGDGRRIEIRGPVDAGLIEQFGGSLPPFVSGTAVVTAKLRQVRPALWHADIEADLKNTAIDEDLSGFRKAAGMQGKMAATGQAGGEAGWAIEQFSVASGDQMVTGSLRPIGDARQLVLDKLSTPVTDLAGVLVLGDDGGVRGKITGRRERLPSQSASTSVPLDDKNPSAPTPLDLDLHVDRVATQAEPLQALAGRVVRDQNGFADVQLGFDLHGPGSLRITPAPDARRHRLELNAADAGALVAALGGGSGVQGGRLKVEADLQRQVPDVTANGRIDIDGATLQAGSPILFQKIVIPFRIDGPKITLDEARLTGPTLGIRGGGGIDRRSGMLDMAGEVTPLYPLNRFLGQIPIIGTILGGSKGLGAINADFTLRGTLDDPKVELQAGSVLVPGVIRDVLHALEPR